MFTHKYTIYNILGRSDEIVKGSWVIGALLSVICEAGHYTTFKEMMKMVLHNNVSNITNMQSRDLTWIYDYK